MNTDLRKLTLEQLAARETRKQGFLKGFLMRGIGLGDYGRYSDYQVSGELCEYLCLLMAVESVIDVT